MQEYTPAHSVYDDEDLEYEGDELRASRVAQRFGSGVCHLVVCTILLAIMAELVQNESGSTFSKFIL